MNAKPHSDECEPPPSPTDGELLARTAKGDLRALGGLYDRYAKTLVRFARRLGAAHDAEDIVQDTFLRVARLAGTFDPQTVSARAWLFAITFRLVQERRRSVRRLANALTGLARQKQAPSLSTAPAASDLERCLQKLSLAKRSVIVLAEVEGFSCEEIAKMLEIPIGTVWTRLHHARRALRALWEA